MKRILPFLIVAIVLIAAVGATYLVLRSRRAGPVDLSHPTPSDHAGTTSTAANRSVTATLPAGVSVLVEEYGDYQCPPCGQLHPEIKQIQSEYGNRISFRFHNFPLTRIHKNAMTAAQAAEAAALQDHFWQMHDLLYETQNSWKDEADPRPLFTNYAQRLGLNVQQFVADLDSAQVQQKIAADEQQAMNLHLVGTPTILIDGRELKPELTNADGLRKGIDAMLARKAHQP